MDDEALHQAVSEWFKELPAAIRKEWEFEEGLGDIVESPISPAPDAKFARIAAWCSYAALVRFLGPEFGAEQRRRRAKEASNG